MTMPHINWGSLTQDETQAIARDALSELSDDRIIETIVELLSGDEDMIFELSEALEE